MKLAVNKPARDSHLDIKRLDTNVTIAQVNAAGDKLRVSVLQDPGIEIDSLGSVGGPLPDSPFLVPEDERLETDQLRNWVIDGDKFKIEHPDTGQVVELQIAKKPGSLTPTEDIPDIVGQHEMTFSVAFALMKGRHSMLIGPTGTGKTSTYRWFAKLLNWNLVIAPISRGTEAAHLVGDYMPTGQALFEWMDGPVAEAVRLSQKHPTILLFDELNRIGNIAEFSRVYSVLDDTRMLDFKEKRDRSGVSERLECGELFVGATSNPSDDEMADYVGVQDIDPALSSRFSIQPTVDYPPVQVEAAALEDRVQDLDHNLAVGMCKAAKRVRDSTEVRFPISFRELESWAMAIPYYGYEAAAKVAVINKAPAVFRASLIDLLRLS